jgi:integrase
MVIKELAARYVARVGGSAGYLEQFSALAKHIPETDFDPESLDRYLTDALHTLSPQTVYNHRRMLQRLMTFAASEGLLDRSIVRPLRRIKRSPKNPTAWSHGEIHALLQAAAEMPGGHKVRNSVLMRAWVAVAYSTGLRLADLLEIRHDHVRGRRLLIRQQKTGEPHVCYLDDLAMECLSALPRRGDRIFGSLVCRDKILKKMRELTRAARVKGSTKFLRRSGATYAEVMGKNASGHLGHKSPGMKTYYIDRLLLAEEKGSGPTTLPLRAVS